MKNRLLKVILFGCTALAPVEAMAQSQPDEAAATAPQDILVTARRREERLQDVPQAITALSKEQLTQKAIVGLFDLTRVSPSVNVTQSSGGGRQIPLFTIRGQRQGDTLSSVDPSVGVYVGDVLFKRTYGLNQLLFDLGTAEVQKGAQGTLFGLNTTGGNIVFRPNLPTDRFEGSVKLGVGNYRQRMAEGFINIPLGEKAALRIAGRYEKRDGYIQAISRTGTMDYVTFEGFPTDPNARGFVVRPAPGRQGLQDLDGGAIRATLKLNPTDRLESTFTGSYIRSSTGGSGFRLTNLATDSGSYRLVISPATLAQWQAESRALPFYSSYSNVAAFAKTKPAWNVANTTTFEVNDSLTLKNIVGYRKYRTENFDNIDGFDQGLLDFGTKQRGEEFSEEIQLLGEGQDINWIAGAYYQSEKVDVLSYTYKIANDLFRNTPYTPVEVIKNTSKALFAQATQKLDNVLQGLSLTAGGRYTWDDRRASFGTITYVNGNRSCGFASTAPATVVNAAGNPYNYDPTTCLVNLKANFNKFTYAVTLDWKVNRDLLLYAAHRKGYRAGGFGTRAQDAQGLVPFRPDQVNDFEIGAKYAHTFDNGMYFSTNAALYKSNYSDIQRLTSRLAGLFVVTDIINAASARIKGIEIESTFRPVPWLELSGYMSHTDPKYKAFFVPAPAAGFASCPIVQMNGTNFCDVTKVADFAGVPRWQYGLTARVFGELGSLGQGSAQLNWYHQSSFTMQDRPVTEAWGQTPGYGYLNGRVQLNKINGTNINAAFYMNNITNRKYLVGNYSLQYSLGMASSLAGPPRMYGFELSFDF